jgi:hypothetical protein
MINWMENETILQDEFAEKLSSLEENYQKEIAELKVFNKKMYTINSWLIVFIS